MGSIGTSLLQHLDDTVADIDLIVEIFALELVELEVEFRCQRRIHLRYHLGVDKWTVEGPDDIKANPLGISRAHLDMHTLEHVRGELATGGKTFDDFVDDGRLANAVDTTENVDLSVEIPKNMLPAAPQGVDFYLRNIVCVFLHSNDIA